MKKDEDYEIKFWKDWIEADIIKKRELIEKLPILDEFFGIRNIPNRKHFIAMTLNSLFEDLESAVYTKLRLENKKRK